MSAGRGDAEREPGEARPGLRAQRGPLALSFESAAPGPCGAQRILWAAGAEPFPAPGLPLGAAGPRQGGAFGRRGAGLTGSPPALSP